MRRIRREKKKLNKNDNLYILYVIFMSVPHVFDPFIRKQKKKKQIFLNECRKAWIQRQIYTHTHSHSRKSSMLDCWNNKWLSIILVSTIISTTIFILYIQCIYMNPTWCLKEIVWKSEQNFFFLCSLCILSFIIARNKRMFSQTTTSPIYRILQSRIDSFFSLSHN